MMAAIPQTFAERTNNGLVYWLIYKSIGLDKPISLYSSMSHPQHEIHLETIYTCIIESRDF